MHPIGAKSPGAGSQQFAVKWFVNFLAASSAIVVFTLFYRARCFNRQRMPRRGAFIVIANHQSYFDPPLIGALFYPTLLGYLARVGLFDQRLFGWFLRTLNSIPLRQNESDVAAMKRALERLQQGRPVLIFPEGSRSPDGEIHEFQRGVALLIKRGRCPVVPVAVEGCFEAWPRHRALPRLFGQRVAVNVGEPINHDMLMQDGPDRAIDRLREEVISLRSELQERMGGANGVSNRSRANVAAS